MVYIKQESIFVKGEDGRQRPWLAFQERRLWLWNSMELLTVNKNCNGFCLEVGIGGLRISALCPGQPHAEVISGAECQSAFVNDSCLVYATFIKINICRRHLGGGQGAAPSKGNRHTRELRTPKKTIRFQGREQREQWVLGSPWEERNV